MAAWLASRATRPDTALWLVISFALVHGLLWTKILIELKAAQDVHMDVAEAFAWGQKFQLGYGKHPPLSGWIAGLWFSVFPAADWATYALAMTTLGCGLVISWLIALSMKSIWPACSNSGSPISLSLTGMAAAGAAPALLSLAKRS